MTAWQSVSPSRGRSGVFGREQSRLRPIEGPSDRGGLSWGSGFKALGNLALTGLDVLDTPRAAVVSGLKETRDLFGGAGFSPRDFVGQARDNIGVRDVFGFDTGNEWVNRGVGLAADSALDPLFFFGAAGSAAFSQGGSRGLARVAASDTIKGTTTLRSALRFGELTGDGRAAMFMRQLGDAPDNTELASAAAAYARSSGLADEVESAVVTMATRGGGVGGVRASGRFRGRSDELVEAVAGPGLSGVRFRPVWRASGGPQVISQDAWASINAPFRALRGSIAGSRPFRAIADRNPFGSSEMDQAMTRMIEQTAGLPPALRVARIRQAGLRKTMVPMALARLAHFQTEAANAMRGLDESTQEAVRVVLQTPARDQHEDRFLQAMEQLRNADAADVPETVRKALADARGLLTDNGVDLGHISETYFPIRREGSSVSGARRAGMDHSRGVPTEIDGQPIVAVAREVNEGTMRIGSDGLARAVADSPGGANWNSIDDEIGALMRVKHGDDWTSGYLKPGEALDAYWFNTSQALRHAAELSAARAAGTAAWTQDMGRILETEQLVSALNAPSVSPLATEASEALHGVADAASRWAVHQQRRLEAGAGAARLVDANTAVLWERMPQEARRRLTQLMETAPDRQPPALRRAWAEFDAIHGDEAAGVADQLVGAINALERTAARLGRVETPEAQQAAAAIREFVADQANSASRVSAVEAVERLRRAAAAGEVPGTAAAAVRLADQQMADAVIALTDETVNAARFSMAEGLPDAVAAERFADAKALWSRMGDSYDGLRGPPAYSTEGLPAGIADAVDAAAESMHEAAARIGSRLMAAEASQVLDPRLRAAMARIADARDPSSRANRIWNQLRRQHPHLAQLHTNSISQAFAGISDVPARAEALVAQADELRRVGRTGIARALDSSAAQLRDAVDTAEMWPQLERAMVAAGFRPSELDHAAAQFTQVVNSKIASARLTEATGVGPTLTAAEGAGLKAQFDDAVRHAVRAARAVDEHERLNASLASQAGVIWREFHGYAVPADMAESMDAVVNRPRLGAFGRELEKVSSWLRGQLTLSVGFHVRNYIGGAYNNWIANNVGLADYQRFWSEYQRFKKALPAGDREMRDAVEKLTSLGTLGHGQFADDITAVAPEAMQRSWLNPLAGMRDPTKQWALVEANRRAGSTVEDLLRGALGAKVLLNSKHLGEEAALVAATQQVTRWHFDYTSLSTMDRYAKNVAPFWIWYSRNMALQWQLLGANPRVAVSAERLFEAVGDGHAVNPFTPGWYFDQRWVQMGQNTWLTVDLPNLAMHKAMWAPGGAPSGEPAAPVLSMVNPIIKAPLEQMTSRDFMRGYPIVDADDRVRRAAEQLAPTAFRAWKMTQGDAEKRWTRFWSFMGVPISTVSREDMLREARFGDRWQAEREPSDRSAREERERQEAETRRLHDLIEQGIRAGQTAAR